MNSNIISFESLCQSAKGKRVLYRGDFNVPIEDQKILDDTRIIKSLPAIKKLINSGVKLILASHLGRPKKEYSRKYSLQPVAKRMAKLLSCDVKFIDFQDKDSWQSDTESMDSGQVIMLDNLRFFPGEETADNDFIGYLSSLCDFYVSDAFACSHRSHSSIVGITQLVTTAVGPLIQYEIDTLKTAFKKPKTPVMAVIGGSKISSKIKLLSSLGNKMDYILIGGGMANTLLLAKGFQVGKSLVEKDCVNIAKELINSSKAELCLPIDVVVAESLDSLSSIRSVDVENIPENMLVYDVGIKTCALWHEKLKLSKTVVWNGPLGVFETKPFDKGSNVFARFVAKQTKEGVLQSFAGGGDTISLLKHVNALDDFSYVSTGGGAFLEYLEGRILPGLATLNLL